MKIRQSIVKRSLNLSWHLQLKKSATAKIYITALYSCKMMIWLTNNRAKMWTIYNEVEIDTPAALQKWKKSMDSHEPTITIAALLNAL